LTDAQFEGLSHDEQARVLAAYRTVTMLDAVQIHHPIDRKKRRR